jgi:hypothetical protein
MEKNPKAPITRKIVVRISGNAITSCIGDVVLEVPRDATKVEIERALVGLADVLPEPTWSLPVSDLSELEVEVEFDADSTPEVVDFDATEEEASACLMRDEDGTLVLEGILEE